MFWMSLIVFRYMFMLWIFEFNGLIVVDSNFYVLFCSGYFVEGILIVFILLLIGLFYFLEGVGLFRLMLYVLILFWKLMIWIKIRMK